jgi:hypothetical protein
MEHDITALARVSDATSNPKDSRNEYKVAGKKRKTMKLRCARLLLGRDDEFFLEQYFT